MPKGSRPALPRFLVCLVIVFSVSFSPIRGQSDAGQPVTHTVKAGDTLLSIARAYGVTLDQLLTLNELEDASLLQIGQRILVLESGPARAATPTAPATEEATPAATDESAPEPSSPRASDSMPAAPVVEAAAPMLDPADLRPSLCVAVFRDDSENGWQEPAEPYLAGGAFTLFDAAGIEVARLLSDDEAGPGCLTDLERGQYRLLGAPPAEHAWTTPAELWIDLGDGGLVQASFGAKTGLPPSVAPPPLPPIEEAAPPQASVLRQLSGLVALAMACFVFGSGLALALALRAR